MGAIDTTYTFTATDTITSTKMNNIIDQTTFTNDAVFDTTLAVASGKLKVNAQGITSNELANNAVKTIAIEDNAVIAGKIADLNVTTSKIADANITQAKLATNVVGNGPAFRATSSTGTSVPTNVFTKILFQSEDFDTNSNFASSRFTPTVAGYYLISSSVGTTVAVNQLLAIIYKNNAIYSAGASQALNVGSSRSNVSDVVYLNGSTDYIEIFLHQTSASFTATTQTNSQQGSYFSGCLIRSA